MSIQRSQQRIDQTGEVFTPAPLVSEMLDTLHKEVFTDPSKTFLDPAAGDGNFLVQVLERKIANGISPLKALSTIYGVELMEDNVQECKRRLKEITLSSTPKNLKSNPKILKAIDKVLNHNIVREDSLKFNYEAWQPLLDQGKHLGGTSANASKVEE